MTKYSAAVRELDPTPEQVAVLQRNIGAVRFAQSWYGTTLTVVDRWFPSSKQCHVCGCVSKDLALSDRIWTCFNCGIEHDRDFNAAINLHSQAASSVVVACGEDVNAQKFEPALVEAGNSSMFVEKDMNGG